MTAERTPEKSPMSGGAARAAHAEKRGGDFWFAVAPGKREIAGDDGCAVHCFMRKPSLPVIVVVLGVIGLGAWWWRAGGERRPGPTTLPKRSTSPVVTPPVREIPAPPPAAAERPSAPGLSGAEKAARVEKIRRDYEEMTARFAAEFTAAGANFPGGLNGYLRQLALLEREKHNDLGSVLGAAELEELELRETFSGKAVQKALGTTAAGDELKHAVFRIRKEFDDKYALIFDLSPAALLARETERQAAQEKILAVLGPELSFAWLREEGPDFSEIATFVGQQNLGRETALEVWRIRNEVARRNLAATLQPNTSPEAVAASRAATAAGARERLTAVVGPVAAQAVGPGVFRWLPAK